MSLHWVLSGCSFNKQRQHRLLERRGGGDDATRGAGEDHHHHHRFMIIMIITLCVPPRWPILWWLCPIGCPLYSWGKRMGAWNDEWGIWGLIGGAVKFTWTYIFQCRWTCHGCCSSCCWEPGHLGNHQTVMKVKLDSHLTGWMDRPTWFLSLNGGDSRVHISKSLPTNGWTQVGPHRSYRHRVESRFRGLLQRLLQCYFLASVSQHARQGGFQPRNLARLRDRQQRVWPENAWSGETSCSDRERSKKEGHVALGLASWLPPHVGGQHHPRCLRWGRAQREDGLLPSHPLSFLGHHEDFPVGRRDSPRYAWLWLGCLPHRGLLPQLPGVLQQKPRLQSGPQQDVSRALRQASGFLTSIHLGVIFLFAERCKWRLCQSGSLMTDLPAWHTPHPGLGLPQVI